MERGAQRATVHRVANSWTQLKRFTTHACGDNQEVARAVILEHGKKILKSHFSHWLPSASFIRQGSAGLCDWVLEAPFSSSILWAVNQPPHPTAPPQRLRKPVQGAQPSLIHQILVISLVTQQSSDQSED